MRSFGAALGDYETSLDRLTEANFVGKDAATLTKTAEREDHGIYLVRIGIDPCLPLRGRVTLAVIWSADSDEILGEHPQVELMLQRH